MDTIVTFGTDHQRRITDFRRGRRLGPDDHLITWTRPKRPSWMSEAQYEQIPETLTLREIRFDVTDSGRRTETLIVITTLTDPKVYARQDIAANEVGDRPGRIEPRVLKRRRHRYPLMKRPRDALRAELQKT